ncbi:MAG: hypothetical protein ACRDJ9_34850 [Dehalococcoidia bacterium]
MTTERARWLVFTDQAGEYYLLPQETLEQGRIPAEHKAEVERLLADADADVSGYMVATTYTLLHVVNTGLKAIGDVTADAAKAARIHTLLWGEKA